MKYYKYKLSLIIPFISVLAIILNLYNGDILGIKNNIEYLLWFLPNLILFIYISYVNKTLNLLLEIIILILCIIINIYWIYAWEKDEDTNYRHRTEYYDSQAFIGCMLFVILYNNAQNIIDSREQNLNKNKNININSEEQNNISII